jgi:hypothetical protein
VRERSDNAEIEELEANLAQLLFVGHAAHALAVTSHHIDAALHFVFGVRRRNQHAGHERNAGQREAVQAALSHGVDHQHVLEEPMQL